MKISVILIRVICLASPLITLAMLSEKRLTACPFCTLYDHALTLDVEQSDIAIIGVQRETGFDVQSVLKGNKSKLPDQLEFPNAYPGFLTLAVGDLEEDSTIEWSWDTPLSPSAHNYLLQALDAPPEGPDRLLMFLPFLNHKDKLVADDAFYQFAKEEYSVIKKIEQSLDRNRLIEFIEGDVISELRTLSFVMLGICGTSDDAHIAKKFMDRKDASSLRGINSIIACYLSLAGEAGLHEIVERYFQPEELDYQTRFPAYEAIQFHLENEDKIPRGRLLGALHVLIDNSDMSDMIIRDLTKYEDWSQIGRIEKIFKSNPQRFIRVACAKYLLACPNEQAKTLLTTLKEIDSDAVVQAETGKVRINATNPQQSIAISNVKTKLLSSWLTAPWLIALIAGTMVASLLCVFMKILQSTKKKNAT